MRSVVANKKGQIFVILAIILMVNILTISAIFFKLKQDQITSLAPESDITSDAYTSLQIAVYNALEITLANYTNTLAMTPATSANYLQTSLDQIESFYESRGFICNIITYGDPASDWSFNRSSGGQAILSVPFMFSFQSANVKIMEEITLTLNWTLAPTTAGNDVFILLKTYGNSTIPQSGATVVLSVALSCIDTLDGLYVLGGSLVLGDTITATSVSNVLVTYTIP
ncbi:MAG: hypothetical protein KAR35_00080 [Candidatus Heimdallarchaeota archaeon]|nr:hypothetical protein [Candidatus Heimdallarchaeota archaeon]MCK5047747.1 hypothetical protein [Candidatus Heimdallarchaeota archaeon]